MKLIMCIFHLFDCENKCFSIYTENTKFSRNFHTSIPLLYKTFRNQYCKIFNCIGRTWKINLDILLSVILRSEQKVNPLLYKTVFCQIHVLDVMLIY